jgi:hypothetical protein
LLRGSAQAKSIAGLIVAVELDGKNARSDRETRVQRGLLD